MYTRPFIFLLLLAVQARAAETHGTLSLSEALALTLRHNPQLQSFDFSIRSAEAKMIQARLKPNPKLDYTIQNGPGSGPYHGGDIMENTLELSQLVEMGGKRQARINEANANRSVAEWAYQVARVEALKETTQAFVEVLVAQKQMELAEETATLAAAATETTKKRVDAGKANAVELMRSNVAVSSTKIELERARRNLATVRMELAAQWGTQKVDFAAVKGDLEGVKPPPVFTTLVERIHSNPEIARWSAERTRREATLAKQRSLAKSDITLSAGPRVLGKAENITFVVGFSMPLPIRNRNQGNIAEAEAEVAKTNSEQRASEMNVFKQLAAAHQELERAVKEADLLTKEVLPVAKQAEETIAQGYEAGRFTQLEILDARRTLILSRNQHLRALADYHRARAEIEALTAGPITLPQPVTTTIVKPRQ